MHLLRSAAAIIAACSLIHAAAAQAPVTLTIGIVPSVPAASTYLAIDKGYLREAGIEAKIETIDSMSKVVPFLATGQIQIAQGGISVGYFNGLGDGMPVTIALEGGSSPFYHQFVVRSDLADKIRTVADLKGRPLAVTAPGTIQDYEIAKVVESAGLTLKDLDIKYIPFPQMAAGFANKAIDVALDVAPFTEIVVEQKLALRWLDPETLIKPLPMTLLAYLTNVEWAAQNRDLARRVFLALQRGAREYCQAYHHGPNRAEVVAVLVKYGVIKDSALLDRMDWQARDPNGRVNLASLLDVQDFFLRTGQQQKKLPAEKLVDVAYAEEASKTLGPFVLANKDSKLAGCR
jgi:NitT/TauT family transport system substrate-binding protein